MAEAAAALKKGDKAGANAAKAAANAAQKKEEAAGEA